ncbi:SGF29 tudor-like domain-containing protein [Trichoderma breve]|uniref:SGF29 tudor-like domain-containing protein n=1 Tax=Trichoderma breve TaxID=2034170 RepID=A0A9W9JPM0_9HYPO|nr:SGF29 tudor-like domain-containing protein [Trichoderma breve]KAJ4863354.1 SGF29 tudor-like domain-containing protein [Trichoderma breve]
MANRKTQREISNLAEDLGPYYSQPGRRDMSQRNRSGRGSNRNNGGAHGEEVQIWDEAKASFNDLINGINSDNDNLGQLVNMDKQAGTMDSDSVPTDTMKQMEELCRSGVKKSEDNITAAKNLMERLKVIRAVVVAKEQAEAPPTGPSKRSTTRTDSAAAAAASLYEFNEPGDSPVPSPMADSVEPPGSTSGAAGSSTNKSKILFSKGDEVAFKPKAVNGEQTSDWILGEVAQVLGEGKSRRYKVIDIEPDDQSKQKEYRSSASSMIPITPESQASSLKDYEAGHVVLALYPQTTTFYKAEVHSMTSTGKVDLKFEGENDSTTLQQVERRYVIEYRV